MSRFTKSLLTLSILTSLCISTSVFAAAYQLYEVGAPINGTAAVGQAALADDDASTAYFNPAGMALLPNSEFMLAGQMLLPYINFRANNLNTISGGNGGNAGLLTPGMSMFFVYNQSPCLKFGLALVSPYGGALNYTDGWTGRYDIQDVMFYTINLNPSMAFRFTDWMSVGIGFSVEYMNLMQTVALPNPDDPDLDGQINIKVSNTRPGFNAGLLFTPMDGMKIGIAYRSQILHRLGGDLTFYRLANNPGINIRMNMPSTVTLSYAQEIYCYGKFLAELGWADWSSMRNSVVNLAGFTFSTPLHWNNTYRYGIGGQLNVNPILKVQAGFSYDSSPTKTSRRLPELPMDRQIRIGTGLLLDVAPNLQLATSYEYINMGSAPIRNTSRFVGTLSGRYVRNYVNAVQFSLNAKI